MFQNWRVHLWGSAEDDTLHIDTIYSRIAEFLLVLKTLDNYKRSFNQAS